MQSEVQSRKTAHGKSDDMRLVDSQPVQNRQNVITGMVLAVHIRIRRHLRRREAACCKGDTAIAPGEIAHLRFPTAHVAGKLMDENDRLAFADLFIIEIDAVRCSDCGHNILPG